MRNAPATSEPGRRRLPSYPEIETYLEIEADLPPESGLDPELESELALNIVLSGFDDDGSVSIEIDDDDATVPTDIGRSSPALKVPAAVAAPAPVAEPIAAAEARRPRTITAQNNAAVSGTISIPDDPPPAASHRAKRHSEGGGD